MDEQITTLKKEEKDVQTSKGSSGRITLAEVSADLTQATKADARAKKINLAFKKLLEKMYAPFTFHKDEELTALSCPGQPATPAQNQARSSKAVAFSAGKREKVRAPRSLITL